MFLIAIASALVLPVAGNVAEARPKKKRRAPKRIAPLTAAGLPNVQAASAIVVDADNGIEFYSKNPDDVRAIASTGKIFVAMVVRKKGIDLDARTAITKVDRDHARGGARTRLSVKHSYRHIDLLRALLIASDNRAPTALGRAVGLTPDQLIEEMNILAKELGLSKTKFTDPSGLRGNESTAREMAIALSTAMKDPVLREIMSTPSVEIVALHSKRRIHYRNTNRALHSQRYPVQGGKTGFTNAAGYCLLISVKLAGRDVTMAFLGAPEKLTRYGDFNRVGKWLMAGGLVDAKAATAGATAAGVGSL